MNRQTAGKGLTVLEVIIILFFVAIVAALVAPMFMRTGGHGRKDSCICNLKECGIALLTYAGDYDGNLPSSALASHSGRWNKRDYVQFATMQGTLPPGGLRVTWPQLLYGYMKSKDIMFCPSDPTPRYDPNSRVSYFWKLAIDKAWFGEQCAKPYRNEKDFVDSADVIVMYECSGFHLSRKLLQLRPLVGMCDGVRFGAVFLDTHVKYCMLANGPAIATMDPTAPGEPAYFNCRLRKGGVQRLPPNVRPTYVDPNRYCDYLP